MCFLLNKYQIQALWQVREYYEVKIVENCSTLYDVPNIMIFTSLNQSMAQYTSPESFLLPTKIVNKWYLGHPCFLPKEQLKKFHRVSVFYLIYFFLRQIDCFEGSSVDLFSEKYQKS